MAANDVGRRYWIQTLGCPKNEVDSDKLVGTLVADGYVAADDPADADLVVVNTCAFIGDARQESIDTVLALHDVRADGLAARRHRLHGRALRRRARRRPARGRPGRGLRSLASRPSPADAPSRRAVIPVSAAPLSDFDLLNLPRPASARPWAYVKVAEGCDRNCGFCAIPSFRGPQRSRTIDSILDEVDALDVARGRARGAGPRRLRTRPGTRDARHRPAGARRRPSASIGSGCCTCTRPTSPTRSIDVMCEVGVPYFDLSLQHVSRPLLRRMRRWGDGDRFVGSHRGHPRPRARRRVPVELHRRLPGRDRGRPRRAARASWTRRRSTGAVSSRSRPRTARTR